MSDPGTRYTDKKVAAAEKRLRALYDATARDIVEKLNEHNQRFREGDALRRGMVAAGKMTQEAYEGWVRRQMLTEKTWKDKLNSAAIILLEANQQAARIVDGERRAVFGENATYQAYQMEHDAGLDLSFTVYDTATVTRILRDRPELMPRRIVDGERDKAWNRDKMAAIIGRGIVAGLSIPDIAKRIAEETAAANEKAAVRYARTAMTAAQNAGRMEALHDAQEMGIEVRKVWLATLDERTRDAHQALDGQAQKVDDPFDSILGPIMYPGDPGADDANVWNCRCTLTYEYKEYPQQNAMRYDQLNGVDIEDISYADWKAAKESQKPKDAQRFQQYEKDEYDKAYKELFKELNDARSALDQAQKDVLHAKAEWVRLRRESTSEADIEAARIAYEETKARLNDATHKLSQVRNEYSNKFGIEATAEAAQKQGINYVPLQTSGVPFDQQAVIDRLAGGDLTKGSCASLGFCYVAQKAGYNVIDFRGGESCNLFAHNCVDVLKALQSDGISTFVGGARSYITAGKRALANVQAGKEYYFECGRHAAIVRTVDGNLQYLELQSGRSNGWKPFGNIDHTLSWRFGATRSSGYDVSSYLLDADEMAKSDHLLKIMGYINTNEDDQKKGSAGSER